MYTYFFIFVLFQVCMICLYVWYEYKNKMLRWIQKDNALRFLYNTFDILQDFCKFFLL